MPLASDFERLTILSVLRAIFEMFFFMALQRFVVVFVFMSLFDDSKLQPKTTLQKSNTSKRSKRSLNRKNELSKRFE